MAETRVEQALREARVLLEHEGVAALTMRRLAEQLGIRAPSLYKHVSGKAELELRLVTAGLEELGEALEAGGDTLGGVAAAYRAWGRAHPALYGLIMDRRFPRGDLPAGLEERVARPLVAVLGGDQARVRAAWASAHGLLSLELAGRFPPGADLEAAWAAYAGAFSA